MGQLTEPGHRPPPRGFGPTLLMMGPGIVLAGGVVGSGELINTPIQAAQFGVVLLWAVILSCLIKYFLQVEIGRHCIVHDRTVFEALNLVPGPKLSGASWFVLLFMGAWTIAQVGSAGILGTIAGILNSVVPLPFADPTHSVRVWAVALVLVAQLILWRGVYQNLEKVIIALVVGFSACVLIALVLLQRSEFAITGDDLVTGLSFSLGETQTQLAAYAVITLIGALGVSGMELLVYPYWVREKGYARFVGSSETAGWVDRAHGWVRMLRVDAAVATLLATVITTAFFLLGAAILFRQGSVPQGEAVVDQMSGMFTETYGPWSRSIFLFGAFCTLFSTLLTATAANGRLYSDLWCSLGVVERGKPESWRRSIRVMQSIFLFSILVIFLGLPERPEELVILSHYIIGLIGTPFAILGGCWLAFKTDRRVRMGRLTTVCLVLSVVVILVCLAIGFAEKSGWLG